MIIKINGRIAFEEIVAHEQHHKELLENADRQRLVRQMSRNGTILFQNLLGQLGEQLVKWGCRLQAQYGTLTEVSKSICREAPCQQYDDLRQRQQHANIQA
ncbi:MAG: hypothetical protein GY832_41005 [Chloroflexi bacterium]|nr:hypothetical protein [Chloroflexota bacterium]